ncbi:MAG: glycosyltransferase family 4 protein [Prevotellaceae bacterium]|nr:glycosyltransferase family 4 protein [Prevotellaceae bacterium]
MIKVFHIVTHFDVGGAERVAVNIAKSKTEDIEYHIVELVRAHSEFTRVFIEELHTSGIKYHRGFVPPISFHYLFERFAAVTFPLWFIFLHLKYRPTVIHAHTEVPDIAVFSFFRLFPFLLKRCKVIRTIHNTQLWTGLRKTGSMVERFYIKHKSNIAISTSVQERYIKVYGEKPPIIHNGVEEVQQKPFEGIVKGKTNILFAGRFEPQKGINTLIEIIRRMEEDTRYHFHVIGDGSMKADIEQGLQGCKNVSLYPPVYGLSAYLSSFDYLLMPSMFEGLSIMSIEASLEGLPVIANSCPGLIDTLPDGWALAVKDNDINAYMNIFNNTIPSSSRTELGKEAKEFALKNFGIRRMQECYEDVYRRNL